MRDVVVISHRAVMLPRPKIPNGQKDRYCGPEMGYELSSAIPTRTGCSLQQPIIITPTRQPLVASPPVSFYPIHKPYEGGVLCIDDETFIRMSDDEEIIDATAPADDAEEEGKEEATDLSSR